MYIYTHTLYIYIYIYTYRVGGSSTAGGRESGQSARRYHNNTNTDDTTNTSTDTTTTTTTTTNNNNTNSNNTNTINNNNDNNVTYRKLTNQRHEAQHRRGIEAKRDPLVMCPEMSTKDDMVHRIVWYLELSRLFSSNMDRHLGVANHGTAQKINNHIDMCETSNGPTYARRDDETSGQFCLIRVLWGTTFLMIRVSFLFR